MKKLLLIIFVFISFASFSQEVKKDTCVNKNLFIRCESERMELEAKYLTLSQYYEIEKHNRNQSDRFAVASWVTTAFIFIQSLIFIKC